jgi:prepilin-type N-terminal cleavage/methylation domain-containing protein
MTSFPSAKTGWRAKTTSGTGKGPASPRAFTLVELVIAITVVAILTGLAVPAIDGIQRERLARAPVSELLLLAREVRGRAMREERAYQIVIDSQGFRASRFLRPYAGIEEAESIRLEMAQLAEREEMIEASQERGIQVEAEVAPDPEEELVREGLRYFQEVAFPENVRVSVRFWNDTEWIAMEGSEYRRWIFQPSGMCEPMKIRVEADNSFFEVEFHPLTADVKTERSWVE